MSARLPASQLRCTIRPPVTVSRTGASPSSSAGAWTGSSPKAVRSARKPGAIRPARSCSPAATAACEVQPSSAISPVSACSGTTGSVSYAHPHAIPLLMTSPVRAPKVLRQYEQAVRLLLDVGFPMTEVMTVITALENLVLGSALDLAAPETMWELPPDSPGTEKLAEALAAIGTRRADAAFELALGAFVNHCRVRLDPPAPHSGPSANSSPSGV